MSASDKVHRWLDLLASLLSRHYPVSLADLRRDVPGYADDSVQEESLLRTFERDKGELRELGVVIDTVPDENGVGRYQLRKQDFYLPLLLVCEALLPNETEVREQPRRGRPAGLSAVPSLVLTPDECHALRRAAARCRGQPRECGLRGQRPLPCGHRPPLRRGVRGGARREARGPAPREA